jgi:creatinine amidohydrolase
MTARPYILEETTWGAVRGEHWDVAVLPWGATEPHNLHLPYGTDSIQTAAIAAESARIAWESGARVMVLPTIPLGVQTGQLDLTFALNLNPSTQRLVLGDVARALEGQGVKKLVVLNGHGGNDFRPILRELQPELKIFLSLVDWFRVRPGGMAWFEEPGDHAGELETSLMQHLTPGWVRPMHEAGPGAARPPRIDAFREGWAWAPRPWSQVTPDTGVGDPSRATPEKGAAYFQALTAQLGGFLKELAALGPEGLYGDAHGAVYADGS